MFYWRSRGGPFFPRGKSFARSYYYPRYYQPQRFNNDPRTGRPIVVPGFGGCPLDYEDVHSNDLIVQQFDHGANSWVQSPRLTVREVAMLHVMDALTDKKDWHSKVQESGILSKWRQEAMTMPLISERTWTWIATEMRDKAGFYREHGFTTSLESGSPCAKSDELILEDLKQELRANVVPLLEASEKDWHPGSKEQVLNLCHPSLYPLVYGRTKILEDCIAGLDDCLQYGDQGVVVPVPEEVSQEAWGRNPRSHWGSYDQDIRYSTKYQWLPAEVKSCGPTGTDIRLESYINNLHPVGNRLLYSTVEKLISKAIPMWNSVLVKDYDGRFPPRIMVDGADFTPTEVPDWPCIDNDEKVGECDEESLQRIRDYMALPDDPDYDSSDDVHEPAEYFNGDWENDGGQYISELVNWKFNRIRRIYHPEPGIGYTYEQWKAGRGMEQHAQVSGSGHHAQDMPLGSRFVSKFLGHEYKDIKLERDFRQDGLQVIVKLSSIELTPEKPKYEGGSWHIEGLRNERIVGTAIYYYDTDNVTDSRIRFRQEADLWEDTLEHEQDDHRPLETIFGTQLRDGEAIQEVGSIATPEGRIIAFPNTLQHCVEPFELGDKSRPGHRRILVLWLVDPHYRILSTANVPPQQRDWYAAGVMKFGVGEKDLPDELAGNVANPPVD